MLEKSSDIKQILKKQNKNKTALAATRAANLDIIICFTGEPKGRLRQSPDIMEGGWCYDYIRGLVFLCDYALRCHYSCGIYNTQKVAPSLWSSKTLLFSTETCRRLGVLWLSALLLSILYVKCIVFATPLFSKILIRKIAVFRFLPQFNFFFT